MLDGLVVAAIVQSPVRCTVEVSMRKGKEGSLRPMQRAAQTVHMLNVDHTVHADEKDFSRGSCRPTINRIAFELIRYSREIGKKASPRYLLPVSQY